MENINSCKGI